MARQPKPHLTPRNRTAPSVQTQGGRPRERLPAEAGLPAAVYVPPAVLSVVGPWLITAAALAIRLFRLGREPLWFDEAYTALTAVKPVGEIVAVLQSEGNPPLYYLLLHVWSACFGDGEWALRLLSAVIGAATVPLVYWVGARLFSTRAGLIAAALAAVSPLQVHYSQEVRMYCMVPPLTLALLWALHRLLTAPNAVAALVFAVAATAGLYVHYYFLFLLPLAGYALLVPDRRRVVPVVAGALLVVALGFGPWWGTFFQQAGSGVQDWVAEWWRTRPFWYAVPWSLESLGPGAQYPPMANFKFASSLWARAASLGLAALVLGGAGRFLAAAWRALPKKSLPVPAPMPQPGSGSQKPAESGHEHDHGHEHEQAWLLTLSAVLLPLLIAFVLSAVRQPIYVVARHDMIAWGPYYLLAGAVFARLKPPLAYAATAVWLGLSLVTLVPYFGTVRPKRNYADFGNSIAPEIVARVRPGEMVVFTAATRTMTQYYLRATPQRWRLVAYPLGSDVHLGWTDPRIRTDPAFAAQVAGEFTRWLSAAPPLPAAVWVVAPQTRGTPALLAELERLGYRADGSRSTTLLLCLQHE